MKKAKGPKWSETRDPSVEQRTYTNTPVNHRVGRSTLYITCPFCGDSVRTVLWSLCGGGKRCSCGALFGSLSVAFHWRNVNHALAAREPGEG